MIDRFRDIARVLVAVLLLGMAAAAETTPSPTSPGPTSSGPASPGPASPAPASQAGPPSTAQAPAQPAGPQINTAEITARANADVGVDIQTTISGWQRELDRLDSDLKK